MISLTTEMISLTTEMISLTTEMISLTTKMISLTTEMILLTLDYRNDSWFSSKMYSLFIFLWNIKSKFKRQYILNQYMATGL